MAGLMMPPAQIIEPVVVESFGVPEIFCHGGVTREGPEVVEVLLYRRDKDGQCFEVARVFIPRAGFEQSLFLAMGKILGPAH